MNNPSQTKDMNELDALLNTKGKNNVSLTSNSDTPGSSSIVDDTPQQDKS